VRIAGSRARVVLLVRRRDIICEPRVDGGTVVQQRMSERGTAVVIQWSEQKPIWAEQVAFSTKARAVVGGADQVVPPGVERARGVEGLAKKVEILCHDRIA